MLVRTNAANRRPIDRELAAVAGERASCSELKYRRGSEVFGEGEDAEYVYQIISGAVRSYRLLTDGRRQISSFHLPGDMLGLENGATHRFTAEAVIETRIRVTRRRSLLHTMAGQEAIASNLLTLVTRNLQHAEDHMLLLGRKNAVERVAAFLIEMDERLSHPSVMILPMSRRDIADYLGLTLETVSRALSSFRDAHMLQFDGPTQRRVVLLDRKALANMDN